MVILFYIIMGLIISILFYAAGNEGHPQQWPAFTVGSAVLIFMLSYSYYLETSLIRSRELNTLVPRDAAVSFIDAKYKEKNGFIPTPTPTNTPDPIAKYVNEGV
jgi:hypothetical protein